MPVIDYDSLAAEHGGTPVGEIDYDALARQMGGEEIQPDSSIGSFLRGAKASIASGLGGLAGGTAGVLAGEGVASIPLGMAGAAGGSALGEEAYRGLMGEEGYAREQAQLEANRLAHSLAGGAGEMLPALLPASGAGRWMKEAPGLLSKMGGAAEAGLRMGAAGEAKHQVDTGEFDPTALVTHPLEEAVKFGPVGLVPAARGILTSVGLKAPADAAVMTLTSSLYDHFVHDKPLDLSGYVDETGKAIPSFMLLNAITGLMHGQPLLPKRADGTALPAARDPLAPAPVDEHPAVEQAAETLDGLDNLQQQAAASGLPPETVDATLEAAKQSVIDSAKTKGETIAGDQARQVEESIKAAQDAQAELDKEAKAREASEKKATPQTDEEASVQQSVPEVVPAGEIPAGAEPKATGETGGEVPVQEGAGRAPEPLLVAPETASDALSGQPPVPEPPPKETAPEPSQLTAPKEGEIRLNKNGDKRIFKNGAWRRPEDNKEVGPMQEKFLNEQPSTTQTDAGKKQAAVEVSGGEPPRPPAQVAEGKSGELQQAPQEKAKSGGEGLRQEGNDVQEVAAPSPETTPEIPKEKSAIQKRKDEVRARIKSKQGNVSTGIDPTLLADYAELGALHVADGAVKFAEWSRQMIEDIGDAIRPHLQAIYDRLRGGGQFEGMEEVPSTEPAVRDLPSDQLIERLTANRKPSKNPVADALKELQELKLDKGKLNEMAEILGSQPTERGVAEALAETVSAPVEVKPSEAFDDAERQAELRAKEEAPPELREQKDTPYEQGVSKQNVKQEKLPSEAEAAGTIKGFNTELDHDLTEDGFISGDILKSAVDFIGSRARWGVEMVKKFGQGIARFLSRIWEHVQGMVQAAKRDTGAVGKSGSGKSEEAARKAQGEKIKVEVEAANAPKETPEPVKKTEEERARDQTSLKNALNEADRILRGLPPVTKTRMETPEKYQEDYNQRPDAAARTTKIINDLKHDKRTSLPEESAALAYHIRNLRNSYDEAEATLNDPKTTPEERVVATENFKFASGELDEAQHLADRVGSEWSMGGRLRQLYLNKDFSVEGITRRLKAIRKGGEVSKEELEEIKKSVNEEKDMAKDQKVRSDKAVDENLKPTGNVIDAELEKTGEKYSKKTDEKLAEEGIKQAENDGVNVSNETVERLLRVVRSGKKGMKMSETLEAVKKMLAEHFPDVTDDQVKSMVENYQEERLPSKETVKAKVKSVQAEVDKLSKPRKGQTDEQKDRRALAAAIKSLDEWKRRFEKGEWFRKPKEARQASDEVNRVRADRDMWQARWEQEFREEQQKQKTGTQKRLDTLTAFRRFQLLSSPLAVLKLAMAAMSNVLKSPVEGALGKGLSAVTGRIGKAATIEGRGSISATTKALAAMFSNLGKDVKQSMKTGKMELDLRHAENNFDSSGLLNFFGRVHAAIKAPLKRFSFVDAMERQLEDYHNETGKRIPAPEEVVPMEARAYEYAQRQIFMQDSKTVKAWQRFVAEWDKQGGVKRAAAVTSRLLLPILRVPTNIAKEAFAHVFGIPAGLYHLGRVWKSGMENIPPEHADQVIRLLKKGSIGGAFMLMGFYNPQLAGGYYQDKEKRAPGDAKAGQLKIGDYDVPKWMSHIPLFEALQIGSTLRRVSETKAAGAGGLKGVPEATQAALWGLTSEIPFADEIVRLGKLGNQRGRDEFAGEFVKSLVVPAAVDYAAKQGDLNSQGEPNRVKTDSTVDYLKSGVPGLRQTLPLKPLK